jgi:hypothetical protein
VAKRGKEKIKVAKRGKETIRASLGFNYSFLLLLFDYW